MTFNTTTIKGGGHMESDDEVNHRTARTSN